MSQNQSFRRVFVRKIVICQHRWKPEIAMKSSQNLEPWTEVYRGGDTTFTQKELEPGMWVSFRVRSFNSHGESEQSDPVSAFMKQKVEQPYSFFSVFVEMFTFRFRQQTFFRRAICSNSIKQIFVHHLLFSILRK